MLTMICWFSLLVYLSHFSFRVDTACYILKWGFHRSLGLQSPYELWHDHKPNPRNLWIFCCGVYAFVRNVQRNKLDPRATKSIFIAYREASGYKVYKLYNPQKQRTVFRRNVIFQENGLSTKVSSSLLSNLPPLLPTPHPTIFIIHLQY